VGGFQQVCPDGSSWASSCAGGCESILVELLGVEDLSSLEHEVHRTGELGAQDGQGLALAVAFLEPLMQGLGRGIAAQERGGQLPEDPLQMRVADLAPGVPQQLAVGLPARLDQPAVGQEVLYPREALDGADLMRGSPAG
jgi:hypothetical protein